MTYAKIKERNDEIRELYATGDYSRKDLAEKFKLCTASIGGICKGIKRDRSKIKYGVMVSAVDYKEAARLYVEEKWTLNQIGEKYSVSRERVRHILAKQGITNNTVRRLCVDCKKELTQTKGRRKKLCKKCADKRWFENYKKNQYKACKKCGELTTKNDRGCGNCRTIRKEERWKKIQKLWNEDKLTMKEIAKVIGTTKNTAYQDVHRMRNAGWEVKRRNSGFGDVA